MNTSEMRVRLSYATNVNDMLYYAERIRGKESNRKLGEDDWEARMMLSKEIL